VPLIESVPGALDASAQKISVKLGAAYKKGKKTISYGTLRRSAEGRLPGEGDPVVPRRLERGSHVQGAVPEEVIERTAAS